MVVYPNAKINIGLNIIRKRADGFHDLETIFYPIDLKDKLEIEKSKTFKFEQYGMNLNIDPENNLVVKAFRLLQKDFKLPNLTIKLQKNIPAGAGLGGGSADAAFMLKAVNKLFSLNIANENLEKYALKLGSDCPFFMKNKATFAQGTGNIFSAISLDLSQYTIRTIKPDVFVSTPDAFAGICPQLPQTSLKELIKLPLKMWKNNIENDFEKTVLKKQPEIAQLKAQMYTDGAIYASMSGSGSAVFGIFDKK